MKRIFIFGGMIAVATLVIWLAGHALYAPPKHPGDDTPWPFALGRLRDVPQRYPSHDVNTNAAEVVRLAAALEIDVQQEDTRSREPYHPRALRAAMRKYVVETLRREGDAGGPPPEAIAQFLAGHQPAIAAVRAQLNANAPPRWRRDLQDLYEPPRPNLGGHSELTSLLAIDALEHHRAGDDATAWLDLDAMWKLARGLLTEPDAWSTYNGVTASQMTAGIAARLSPPVPLWWRSFMTFDFDRANAAAMQYEAWHHLTFTQRHPAGESDDDNALEGFVQHGADLVFGPFRIEQAQRSAVSMRKRAERLARTPPCAGNEEDFPFTRTRRFLIEREGVDRYLALKEAHRATGAWPATIPQDSQCTGHTWKYTPASTGIRLSLTPPLPAPRGSEARLALPLTFSAQSRP